MKNLKYIIAVLFVVAVGAGIFWACQKEETTENSSVTKESNKIQKVVSGTTYTADFYREINGKCYHVTGTYLVSDDGELIYSDGLIYTEVDCITMFTSAAYPLQFAFEPKPDVEFLCETDYMEPSNYNFTVISGGESFTTEELNIFFQDALVTIYYIIN